MIKVYVGLILATNFLFSISTVNEDDSKDSSFSLKRKELRIK